MVTLFYKIQWLGWRLFAFRRKRRVLFVLVNPLLSDQYLTAIHEILSKDSRVVLTVTTAGQRQETRSAQGVAKRLGLRFRGFHAARLRPWDLIIFTDHGGANRFSPYMFKMQMYHSLTGGKRVAGENYRFGIRNTIYRNKPLYEMMFVPSVRMKHRSLQTNPLLEGSVEVVGDLFADDLLALNAHRESIRSELGFEAHDKVILIQSTFGPHSLLESMGAKIVKQARGLLSEYRFVLSTHPLHWSGAEYSPTIDELVGEELRDGIIVMQPHDSWENYAVASDACLSDHTGLACNYALLRKPMSMITIPDGVLSEGAEELLVYDSAPRLDSPKQLASILAFMTKNPANVGMAQLATSLLSYPGESRRRIADRLYQVLKLDAVEEK